MIIETSVKLQIVNTLRPCYYQNQNKGSQKLKALFHQLTTIQRPVPGGLTIGSAPGGQLSTVYAVIELENGTIRYVDPYEITFIDNSFGDYCWPDDEKENKK